MFFVKFKFSIKKSIPCAYMCVPFCWYEKKTKKKIHFQAAIVIQSESNEHTHTQIETFRFVWAIVLNGFYMRWLCCYRVVFLFFLFHAFHAAVCVYIFVRIFTLLLYNIYFSISVWIFFFQYDCGFNWSWKNYSTYYIICFFLPPLLPLSFVIAQ